MYYDKISTYETSLTLQETPELLLIFNRASGRMCEYM